MILSIFSRAGMIFASLIATYQNDGLYVTFIITAFTVPVLHIIVSCLLQVWLLRGGISNLKEALWSFISPPLYLDWEYLHRKENYDMPVPECWRRTRKSFLLHNFL